MLISVSISVRKVLNNLIWKCREKWHTEAVVRYANYGEEICDKDLGVVFSIFSTKNAENDSRSY